MFNNPRRLLVLWIIFNILGFLPFYMFGYFAYWVVFGFIAMIMIYQRMILIDYLIEKELDKCYSEDWISDLTYCKSDIIKRYGNRYLRFNYLIRNNIGTNIQEIDNLRKIGKSNIFLVELQFLAFVLIPFIYVVFTVWLRNYFSN